jgi:hypothetical protein
MTAQELIAELQKLNPNEVIYVKDVDCGYCSNVPIESECLFDVKVRIYVNGQKSKQTVKVLG